MSQSSIFPDRYHIVWLDTHIGSPGSYLQLKRAFFTHIDPKSGQEVSLSEKDIDFMIQEQSEFSGSFDTFHFTLNTFVEEKACLQYIEKIQNHRILLIASNKLGESAVKQIIERYPHSFTNKQTNEPYDSIYIFCFDLAKAAEWACSYDDYVQLFDFEADLLQRMTRDLGDEFLKQGQQLLEMNDNKLAAERLSWSRSLFIRHESLKLPRSPANSQAKLSPELQKIDQLLTLAEERKQNEDPMDLDQDDHQTHISLDTVVSPMPDHLIICLMKWASSRSQMAKEIEYGSDLLQSTAMQTDDSATQNIDEFEYKLKTSFTNIPGDLKSLNSMDECRDCIVQSTSSKAIFLVTSALIAEKILPNLSETYGSIKKIYILGDCNGSIAKWIDHYRDQGIDIRLFDLDMNLLIRLLQDISRHYVSKGESCTKSMPSSVHTSLIYFNWAKEMIIRANHLAQNQFENQLNNIAASTKTTEISINQVQSNLDVEERLRHYQQDEDSDSLAIIFIVGLELRLIHLASGITRLITCATNNQIVSAIRNVKLTAPTIIVSSSIPTDELLSLNQLLYYYCFLKVGQPVPSTTTDYQNIEYVSSIDHLMDQLHHQLGQYYRDAAIRASIESRDQNKARRLLEKSTQCYQTLKTNSEEILKRYAELLNKK